MNTYKKVLALALAAALPLLPMGALATVTETSAGGPINSTFVLPTPAPSMNCANVSLTTFSATSVLSQTTSRIRTGLYIVNTSTTPLATQSRAPIIWWTPSSTLSEGSAGIGPTIGRLPFLNGIPLHAAVDPTAAQTATLLGDDRFYQAGSGVYQGAIYAVAESTGAGVNVKAVASACEWY